MSFLIASYQMKTLTLLLFCVMVDILGKNIPSSSLRQTSFNLSHVKVCQIAILNGYKKTLICRISKRQVCVVKWCANPCWTNCEKEGWFFQENTNTLRFCLSSIRGCITFSLTPMEWKKHKNRWEIFSVNQQFPMLPWQVTNFVR